MNRYAVWSILAALTLLLPQAATPRAPAVAIEHAQLMGSLMLDGQLFHVQGVELETTSIWVTSVDHKNHKGYLHEFDRASGRFLRRLELTDGARFHPGGISISGRSIWVPVAEMKQNSTTVLEEIDAESLQIRRKIYVTDHLGCVAASAHTLIAGNWNSKLFYIFDLDNIEPMRVVANPTSTRYQDMKMFGDQLVAGGSLNHRSGTIDWIDWPTMQLTRTLRTGVTSPLKTFGRVRSYSNEGMTLEGRELYVVPEDGPSRMYHFRLDEQAVNSSGTQTIATGLP